MSSMQKYRGMRKSTASRRQALAMLLGGARLLGGVSVFATTMGTSIIAPAKVEAADPADCEPCSPGQAVAGGGSAMDWYYDSSPCPPTAPTSPGYQTQPYPTQQSHDYGGYQPLPPSGQPSPSPAQPNQFQLTQPRMSPDFGQTPMPLQGGSQPMSPPVSSPPASVPSPTPSPAQPQPLAADNNAGSQAANAMADSGDFDPSSLLTGNFGTGQGGSAAAADTTSMVGDFFNVGRTSLNVPLIYRYDAVTGDELGGVGSESFGFDVNGGGTLDLFTTGPEGVNGAGQAVYALQPPVNPTDAELPQDSGITGAQFVGGRATSGPPAPALDGDPFDIFYVYNIELEVPATVGSYVGRMKIAENVSPIPTDRIMFNYSFFDNVPLAGGIGVHRFTPGFEKTLWDGMFSFEMRAPMLITLNSDVFTDEIDISQLELGNLFMSFKALLYQQDNVAISAGVSWTIPTADDLNFHVPNIGGGTQRLLSIENESVHILPFVGGQYKCGNNFVQGFIQVDVDSTGSPVLFNENFVLNQAGGGDTLTYQDDLREVSLLFVDVQAGHWLFRNRQASGVTGMAVLGEVHINQSLEETPSVVATSAVGNLAQLQIGGGQENVSVTNMLVGLMTEYNRDTTVTVAYGTPLGNSVDQGFDGELRVLVNRFF